VRRCPIVIGTMPGCLTTLVAAGMLCVPLARGVCQDDGRAAADPRSSLAHYHLGEAYLRENNLQSAANEFREALNGDLVPAWTEAWSEIQLSRIFDFTGQHDRAMDEYRRAQKTGDNSTGALDEANNYLQLAENAIYLGPGVRPVVNGEPIQKTDPEYTAEARVAELEGMVVLSGSIGEDGSAHNLQVVEPVGLGLDEKAIEAVERWRFHPVVNQGQQYSTAARIAVDFRLSTKQSRWHLIQVKFETPPGASRPVFLSAEYPIGAGLGPEAMEEGRLVVAMGRVATAKLSFQVDQYGVPVNFQIENASESLWGREATALVGQWRFMPGRQNGIPISIPCSVELVWGKKELTSDLERQLHDVFAAR
jgi:TonB family protein